MQSKNLRWYGALTLFVIVAISYIDRINLAVLITDKSFLSHMGIAFTDKASQGFLATAFMVGYGLSSIFITPFVVALFGVRKSLFLGLLMWGGITCLTPHFSSYDQLLFSRAILGIAEGPLFSLASYFIKAHFESHENGKPNAIVNMGTGMGLAIGFPFVGMMLASSDWQTSFYGLGMLNFALGIPLVYLFIKMPTEIANAGKSSVMPSALAQVKKIMGGTLQTRNIFIMTVLTAAFLAYLWGSSNWLPSYLKEARGFSLREMGWLASLPQYAAILAVFIGGLLIDKVGRKRVPLIFVFASIGVALSVYMAINVADRYMATYCLIAASFFWGLQSPSFPSTVQYFSKPEHVASAFGITNGVGSLVAGFLPAIMGAVIASVTASTGGAGGASAGFAAGFTLLIGTQVVMFLGGLILWLRERHNVA